MNSEFTIWNLNVIQETNVGFMIPLPLSGEQNFRIFFNRNFLCGVCNSRFSYFYELKLQIFFLASTFIVVAICKDLFRKMLVKNINIGGKIKDSIPGIWNEIVLSL